MEAWKTSKFIYSSQGYLVMKCPHCGSLKSRVTETRDYPDFYKRDRVCTGCGRNFQTLERVCVYAGRTYGYAEVRINEEDSVPVKTKSKASPNRFVARENDEALLNVCAQARPILTDWWNESRLSKHKSKAVWTRAAWVSSVNRVAGLPAYKQVMLANQGLEAGWQSLKETYLDESQIEPSSNGGLGPKDKAMRQVVEEWNNI